MNKNYKYYATGAIFACAVLLIIATFTDYAVSEKIADVNSVLSHIGTVIGKIPAYLILCAAGAILFALNLKTAGRSGVWKTVLSIGYVLAVLLASFLIFYSAAEDYLPRKYAVLAGLAAGAVFAALALLLCCKSIDGGGEYLRKWCFTAVFSVLTMVIVTLIMKEIWGRVRYADLGSASDFTRWYVIAREGGSSFPSGHAALSNIVLLLLPITNILSKKKGIMLIVAAIAVALFSSVSRILGGHHYLSDVSASLIITLIIQVIALRVAYGKNGENLELNCGNVLNKL